MTKYSQQDSKWANLKIGDGTVGAFGCTITCISMLSDVAPDVLLSQIKSVNGFSGNYIFWDKLDLLPGFDFIKRVRVYDNAEVAGSLPCLVEVDGTPIGGVTHWVLYVGNQKCWDPWDGKEKSTSTYKPIGYAVIRYQAPQALNPDMQKIYMGPKFGEMEVQAIRSTINDQKGIIDNQNKQITDLQSALSECRNQKPPVVQPNTPMAVVVERPTNYSLADLIRSFIDQIRRVLNRNNVKIP